MTDSQKKAKEVPMYQRAVLATMLVFVGLTVLLAQDQIAKVTGFDRLVE